jgi:hypothetical protein
MTWHRVCFVYVVDSHTHTYTHTLSLSLTYTQTHTHKHTRQPPILMGYTVLHEAAERGDSEELQRLLDSGLHDADEVDDLEVCAERESVCVWGGKEERERERERE